MLPAFVRELILQDRGNSLYLSDSFANLPSPVNETQDLKQLFKAKDNEEDLNRNGKRDKKDSNVEIRIEGKEPVGKTEDSIDRKAQANIDVKDIEKIVFEAYVNQEKQPRKEYVEEESYVNPSQAEFSGEPDYEDQRLMSMVNRGAVGTRHPIEY
jgi:hypothetical protein